MMLMQWFVHCIMSPVNDCLMIFFIRLINISHMNILYALTIVEYACMIALVVELRSFLHPV